MGGGLGMGDPCALALRLALRSLSSLSFPISFDVGVGLEAGVDAALGDAGATTGGGKASASNGPRSTASSGGLTRVCNVGGEPGGVVVCASGVSGEWICGCVMACACAGCVGSAGRVARGDAAGGEGGGDCVVAVVEGNADVDEDAEAGAADEDAGVGMAVLVEGADSALDMGAAEPDNGVTVASSPTGATPSSAIAACSTFALEDRPRRFAEPLSVADGSGSGPPAGARGWASALRFPSAFRVA